METIAPTVIEIAKFWASVDKSGNCWTWTAGKSDTGYGQCRFKGRKVGSHRASYEIAKGRIPTGMQIDHTCHNRGCVNPDHLRLATHKENAENVAGARANSTSGIRGVYWIEKRQRWMASLRHNGKQMFIGHFTDVREAEAAVITKRNELFTHNDADRS